MLACVGGGAAAPAATGGPATPLPVEPTAAPDVVAVPDEPALPARFGVRGRWDDPLALTYRVEPGDGPVDAGLFSRAVAQAARLWSRTGVVGLHPAAADERPRIVFGWRRGAHEGCPPFGINTSLAHAGPVAAPTFVHFDAGRSWSLSGGEDSESLVTTAAHEIGHVLGLDHSSDPEALMFTDVTVDGPMASDLAGLHSLYGGGEDGPGDLVIGRGFEAPALRRVAPPGLTDWLLFDTDGDGDDEVLVWRTDMTGVGALVVYHFGPGARLVRTLGPVIGAIPPEARTSLRVDDSGRRWLVALFGERRHVRRFDDSGRFAVPSPLELRDVDLDGAREPPRPERSDDGVERARGDLDGDGIREVVERRLPR